MRHKKKLVWRRLQLEGEMGHVISFQDNYCYFVQVQLDVYFGFDAENRQKIFGNFKGNVLAYEPRKFFWFSYDRRGTICKKEDGEALKKNNTKVRFNLTRLMNS